MGDPGGVVLLHGHGRLGGSMMRLAGAARRAGYATFAPSYPYRRPLDGIVQWLAPRIEAFEQGFTGPLHIVTHSLGGLVARAFIEVHAPRRLGRVVMLGPPNAGSELADLLFRLRLGRWFLGGTGVHLRTGRTTEHEAMLGAVHYPIGIIAGDRSLLPVPAPMLPRPHDGKVSIAATHVAGLTDHMVLPVTHTLMVYDRRVIAAVLAFLAEGSFGRAMPRPVDQEVQ